jgi:alpha-L-fucosidase
MWRDFGAFLKTNGQAIYGIRAWKIIGEGRMAKNRKGEMEMITFPAAGILPKHDQFQMTTEDIRFTEGKDGALYAFIMAPPRPGERLKIRSLGKSAGLLDRSVREVSLLGSSEKIRWTMEDQALAIDCPSTIPSSFALVFRIEF